MQITSSIFHWKSDPSSKRRSWCRWPMAPKPSGARRSSWSCTSGPLWIHQNSKDTVTSSISSSNKTITAGVRRFSLKTSSIICGAFSPPISRQTNESLKMSFIRIDYNYQYLYHKHQRKHLSRCCICWMWKGLLSRRWYYKSSLHDLNSRQLLCQYHVSKSQLANWPIANNNNTKQ